MKKIVKLLKTPGPWDSLLQEYFSEVDAEISIGKDSVIQNADLIFIEPSFCQSATIQKIRVLKSVSTGARVFCLGESPQDCASLFDCVFEQPCDLLEFTKKISDRIQFPESLRVLIADDDADILSMVCDYFSGRNSPAYEVLRAPNGREAFELIQKKRPDAMILDVKMPLMSGSELYCKLQKQNMKIPTIIFYDAISAGDLNDIKKVGRPAIVEKGYRESSLAYLMATIKKLVYFSS